MLVGAAFAVAARRQVRDRGCSRRTGQRGGTFAGGCWRRGSSSVSLLAGRRPQRLLLFRGAIPLSKDIADQEMWRQGMDWRAVVGDHGARLVDSIWLRYCRARTSAGSRRSLRCRALPGRAQ